VDKYERSLVTSHEKDLLRKIYRLAEDGEDDRAPRVDYAPGEDLIEGSEEEEGEESTEESDEEEDVIVREDPSKPIAILEEAEIGLGESQFASWTHSLRPTLIARRPMRRQGEHSTSLLHGSPR